MVGTPRDSRTTTRLRTVIAALVVALFVLLSGPRSTRAQELVLSGHRLYLSGDTLKVDLALDSLFSVQSLDAIASGMTTSITVELRLEGKGRFRPRQHTTATLLSHDIWEGRYQAIRQGGDTDTLTTGDFDEAQVFCSKVRRAALGPLPDEARDFVLKARVSVNPISEAQRKRTRSWLNFLQRGSLLELFFSLDTPTERTGWLEVWRFRREDLP
jgi:hypothetical protein